jgi:nucleoid-associated protein YgaU
MVARGNIWQDSHMRQGWVWVVSITAASWLSGCGGNPDQANAPTDVLVLDIGGQQPSLRASLVAMGRTVAPGKALRPRTVSDEINPAEADQREWGGYDDAGGEDPASQDPADSPEEQPVASPTVAPPESEWLIVKLPKDNTLSDLSRTYLGDYRRWTQIMEWNGWTERDTWTLRAGQDVKIKRSEMR